MEYSENVKAKAFEWERESERINVIQLMFVVIINIFFSRAYV